MYPIFFFATPPISQRHSDPRHARELVSNPAITTNCHWQKIIIRLSSSQVRASTLVELQALQSFSSHSGSLDYINRWSLGDFTKVEETQMEIFNFLWLIMDLPLTPTENN